MFLQLKRKAIHFATEKKLNRQICRIFVLMVLSAFCCLINASDAFSQADFSVMKTASSSTVGAGNNITYTITITNNGPGVSTFNQTILSDAVPENTTFVSLMYNAVDWNCVTPQPGGAGTVNCFNQTTIASGTSHQFTLVVRVNPQTASGMG